MNAASIAELKKSLVRLDQGELLEICLRLARSKKENKELLTYLLFLSGDEAGFISSLCDEIDEQFHGDPITHKKTLRKIIRSMDKWLRFSGNKETAIKVRLYFCQALKVSGTPFRRNKVMSNMFDGQIRKIQKLIEGLHEDLQHDVQWELNELQNQTPR